MNIQTVGVIGAGVMRVGVAQNLAQTGHHAVLLDISDDILERAKQEIKNNIRFQGFFNKNEKADSPKDILDRITFSSNYQLLEKAEFVVKNVTKKWILKRRYIAR